MISKTQVEKMEHQIHVLQKQLSERDPYGEIRKLMDHIMELNEWKCQLQKQVEILSAQLERKETMTPEQKRISAVNKLYFALGALDTAIERLANRAKDSSDWEWIEHARLTAKQAREVYSELTRKQP